MPAEQYLGKPYARQDIAASGTAQGLDATVYKPAAMTHSPRAARVTIEGAAAGTDFLRYTLDGTTPNAGASPPVGDIFQPNTNAFIVLWGEEAMQDFKFLDAGTVIVHVTYYK